MTAVSETWPEVSFEVRIDTAFDAVVSACADPGRDGRWITAEVAGAYGELHRRGWAHSIEAWRDGELVGGLYGIAVGGLFAGESMFHRVTDASKVAFVALLNFPVHTLSMRLAEGRAWPRETWARSRMMDRWAVRLYRQGYEVRS